MNKIIDMLESVAGFRNERPYSLLTQRISQAFLSLEKEFQPNSLEASIFNDLARTLTKSFSQFLEIGNASISEVQRAERFARKMGLYEIYIEEHSRPPRFGV